MVIAAEPVNLEYTLGRKNNYRRQILITVFPNMYFIEMLVFPE